MMRVFGKLVILAGLGALLLSVTAQAQMYRWTDDQGRVHYSDSPPPAAARQERRVLDDRGITVRTLERARTPEEIEAERLEQERLDQARREREEQERRDRVLLQSFGSERELINARDDRVALLDGTLTITREKIRGLREQLARLEEREQRLQSQGREVPVAIVDDKASLDRQIDVQTRYLEDRQAERERLVEQFDADLARLRELRAERR
jgi:hypothetical protein